MMLPPPHCSSISNLPNFLWIPKQNGERSAIAVLLIEALHKPSAEFAGDVVFLLVPGPAFQSAETADK